MTIDSQTLVRIAAECSAPFRRSPGLPTPEDLLGYVERMMRCLTFHATTLAGEAPRAAALLERVRAYPAPGPGRDAGEVDLLSEVALAQACLEGEPPARDAFLTAYQARLEDEARRRFHRVGGRSFDDEMDDSWTVFAEPRPRSGPRLGEFWGRTPLWPFLWLSLTRCYIDWSRRVKAHPKPDPQTSAARPSALDDNIQEELAGKLIEAFTWAVGRLSAADQYLVWSIDYEGRPKKTIAAVLGIHPGNVGRKHEKAVEALRTAALGRLADLHGEAARDECLDAFASAQAAVRERLGDALGRWSARVAAESPAPPDVRLA
ncbi:MAG: hypothetical protein BGO49_10980 [Planctomycetales bacterium 71-10]|nr:MAG: hypothetical protein BGO49_10980 [Planctomycetales bacterium 71-10]